MLRFSLKGPILTFLLILLLVVSLAFQPVWAAEDKDSGAKKSGFVDGLLEYLNIYDKLDEIAAQQALKADAHLVGRQLSAVYSGLYYLEIGKSHLTATIKRAGPKLTYGTIKPDVEMLQSTIGCIVDNLTAIAARADTHFNGNPVRYKLLAGLNEKSDTLNDLIYNLQLAEQVHGTDASAMLAAVEADSEKAENIASQLRDRTKELAQKIEPNWTVPSGGVVCETATHK